MKKKVGIIFALESEERCFASKFLNIYEINKGVFSIKKVELNELILYIIVTGMGTANASSGTQFLIDNFDVDSIISSGILGGIDKSINRGDIIIGEKLFYIDTNADLISESKPNKKVFESSDKLVDIAFSVSKKSQHKILKGAIGTGNKFVNTKEQISGVLKDGERLSILKKNILGVDMESAAIGHICTKNNKDFLIFKTVSDMCDDDYKDFSDNKFTIEKYTNISADLLFEIIKNLIKYYEIEELKKKIKEELKKLKK